jgi:two-component system, chemotaxis family, protein-glutamate methylesterase/glutaminase
MGNDGARELKLMKDKGALTIVQNKESCVIFGTLGEAVKLEGFKKILSP